MKFGPVRVGEAAGAILAHTARVPGRTVRKGTRLADDDIAALAAAGVGEVIVARLEPGDVHEDQAAAMVARMIAGMGAAVERPFTGRSNLVAEAAGVLMIDRAAVDAINRIDPAITVATKPEFAPVAAGELIATVKIIPFGLPRATLDRVAATPAVGVVPYVVRRVGLVATRLPSLKAVTMDKTRDLLEARLAPAGASLLREDRVAHETAVVAEAIAAQARDGAELIVVFGASAVVDEDDVIPAAIRGAGGEVLRLGMPVDPGNLLVLGQLGDIPVLGAPGCARSPKENGFDWILRRLLAGLDVASDDIAALGVGGLLMEIASRPQPRKPAAPRIAALVLAAGESRRMGGTNKLLATVDGAPMVRLAAEAALGSRAAPVIVVTGHAGAEVTQALADLDVQIVANPDYAAGMATSLAAGLKALPDNVDGVVVLLADMPGIAAATVDRLLSAFKADGIVVPVHDGQRGNPVVWSRRFFPELMAVTGDKGGREVLAANLHAVVEVGFGPEVGADIDTPEALRGRNGVPA